MAANYDAQWEEYRWRRKLCLLVFVGFLLLALPVSLVSARYFDTMTPVLVLTGLWAPFYLVVGWRFTYWKCPRCRRAFAATWWYHRGFFCAACVHCGLRKYASDGEVA